ncbi:MAG: exopolysaccharide biosynthesis protein [Rhodobacteraceae bacterium]|nr:MAG: exopolysaccharide biosynthesis protein [Paracoccaceae bacterium]
MPPEPLAMPDLPPAEPDPVESVVEPVAAAPEPSAPAPEPVAAEPEPVAPVAEPVVAQANPATPEVVEPEVEAPDPWTRIRKFPIDARKLERNRIVTATREDPVHSSFDVLRTKLLKALRDNGWSRVAVTSPTEGCGKTFMAANLALSLSRQGNCRTVVLDLDMRHPALAKTMNVANSPAIADFLSGQMPAEDFLRRPGRNPHKIGDNVAFGFNTRREEFAAELLQDGMTARTLDAMEAALKPDVVLLDMPPALVNDDVLAARPLYDGIILVVGGGMTRPQQVRDVERRLGTDTPLLGVVLNKSEDDTSQNYGY